MAAPMEKDVDLGFCEKTDPWRICSALFPSKVGGRAAWLELKDLPTADDVKCTTCGKTCVFLAQVYAPIEKPLPGQTNSFHRTIFVFVCRDPKCCQHNRNQNIVALRSQLGRKNDFYHYDPPVQSKAKAGEYKDASHFSDLCVVCACSGTHKCGQCQHMSYCCKEHQAVHWKKGHKKSCGKDQAAGDHKQGASNSSSGYGVLFPEYELVIEEEEEYIEPAEKTEKDKMKDYSRIMSSGKVCDLGDAPSVAKDIEKMALTDDEVDQQFQEFRKRIAQEPEQVLRYNKGGTPLWVSSHNMPKASDIPCCQYCGGPRQFEFQILPQMLTHLDVDCVGDSLDWGTLAVYTCLKSCNDGPAYKLEYVYKQDYDLKENVKKPKGFS